MIPVTNVPMEGVVFNVQDHARRTGTIWTGTHGEMISSDLHGAEGPIRWLLRPHQRGRDRTMFDRGFAPKKKRTFHQRHFGRAQPRGNDPFSVERWPWKAQNVPILTMMSSSFMVILGGRLGNNGTCGLLERPLGANVLLLDVSSALKGASTSLEGDFTFITTHLGF
jgi:hypothetical protein